MRNMIHEHSNNWEINWETRLSACETDWVRVGGECYAQMCWVRPERWLGERDRETITMWSRLSTQTWYPLCYTWGGGGRAGRHFGNLAQSGRAADKLVEKVSRASTQRDGMAFESLRFLGMPGTSCLSLASSKCISSRSKCLWWASARSLFVACVPKSVLEIVKDSFQ